MTFIGHTLYNKGTFNSYTFFVMRSIHGQYNKNCYMTSCIVQIKGSIRKSVWDQVHWNKGLLLHGLAG